MVRIRSLERANAEERSPIEGGVGRASRPVSLIFKGPRRLWAIYSKSNKCFRLLSMLVGPAEGAGSLRLFEVETSPYLFRALCRFAFCKKGTRKTLVFDYMVRFMG